VTFLQAYVLIVLGLPALPTVVYLATAYGWSGYLGALALLLLATPLDYAAGKLGLARFLPFLVRYRGYVETEYGFLTAAALPFMPYWVFAGASGASYRSALVRYLSVGFPNAILAGALGLFGHALRLPPYSLALGLLLFTAFRVWRRRTPAEEPHA